MKTYANVLGTAVFSAVLFICTPGVANQKTETTLLGFEFSFKGALYGGPDMREDDSGFSLVDTLAAVRSVLFGAPALAVSPVASDRFRGMVEIPLVTRAEASAGSTTYRVLKQYGRPAHLRAELVVADFGAGTLRFNAGRGRFHDYIELSQGFRIDACSFDLLVTHEFRPVRDRQRFQTGMACDLPSGTFKLSIEEPLLSEAPVTPRVSGAGSWDLTPGVTAKAEIDARYTPDRTNAKFVTLVTFHF